MSSDKFYDASESVKGLNEKSDIDLDDEDTIPLCIICSNVRLLPYQDSKLICPNCGHIENPKYEHVQTRALETTIDEISGRGELTDKDDAIPVFKAKNRLENYNENLGHVNREFSKYRETELVDENSRKLNWRLQQ
ncbi:MAG: hypothetical protein P0116_16195 [Candidatus Nitrosocosmicus sp.]|nr:hypothetical protein [Candidatus Nitrosocosmicus sp.]